jgi:hypothetical protein
MISNDLGLKGRACKAGALARMVCAQRNWKYVSKRDVIQRRALELLCTKAKITTTGTKTTRQHWRKIGKPHPDYVSNDGFYRSREWRSVRYLALKTAAAGALAVAHTEMEWCFMSTTSFRATKLRTGR